VREDLRIALIIIASLIGGAASFLILKAYGLWWLLFHPTLFR